MFNNSDPNSDPKVVLASVDLFSGSTLTCIVSVLAYYLLSYRRLNALSLVMPARFLIESVQERKKAPTVPFFCVTTTCNALYKTVLTYLSNLATLIKSHKNNIGLRVTSRIDGVTRHYGLSARLR